MTCHLIFCERKCLCQRKIKSNFVCVTQKYYSNIHFKSEMHRGEKFSKKINKNVIILTTGLATLVMTFNIKVYEMSKDVDNGKNNK